MPSEMLRIAIAGASSGLGKALAAAFARDGRQVFGCGRRPMKEEKTFFYDEVDITDNRQLDRWLSKCGEVDLFIDCVGVLIPRKSFVEYSAEEIDFALSLNLRAKMNLLQKVIRNMQKTGRGVFVSLASNPKGYPFDGLSLYGLCKSANEFLIKSVAAESGSKIVALSLYPGMVDTPMLRQSIGSQAEQFPNADAWAAENAKKLLKVDKRYSGRHISIDELE